MTKKEMIERGTRLNAGLVNFKHEDRELCSKIKELIDNVFTVVKNNRLANNLSWGSNSCILASGLKKSIISYEYEIICAAHAKMEYFIEEFNKESATNLIDEMVNALEETYETLHNTTPVKFKFEGKTLEGHIVQDDFYPTGINQKFVKVSTKESTYEISVNRLILQEFDIYTMDDKWIDAGQFRNIEYALKDLENTCLLYPGEYYIKGENAIEFFELTTNGEIKIGYEPINMCLEDHLEDIKEAIRVNGYNEYSMIFYSSIYRKLITGSHRYRACKELGVKPVMIDIGHEVDAYLYANNMEFKDLDFEEINDYSYQQLLRHFSHYENDYHYGECAECGTHTSISDNNELCVECNYLI